MIKHAGFTFALLCLSLCAQAGVVNIQYTGHITGTSVDTPSYSFGQTVSGNLKIDLSKSHDELAENYKAQYYSYGSDLVTGYISETTGFPTDSVEIFNNSNEKYAGDYIDFLWLMDAYTVVFPNDSWAYKTLQMSLSFVGLDWMSDDHLGNVNLFVNDANTFGQSFGVLSTGTGSKDANGEYQVEDHAAFFAFDSVKITSASLPEPGSLMLLAIGILGLGLPRRVVNR